MWQFDGKEYHFITRYVHYIGQDDGTTGCLCGIELDFEKDKQEPYVMQNKCPTCDKISRMVNSSVDSGMHYVRTETDPNVLDLAIQHTNSVTMKKALLSRRNKLAKNKVPV